MSTSKNSTSQPYAVLGAGDLVSHLRRTEDDSGALNYQFNLFRLRKNAQVTHGMRPDDLRDIVKICQVLAFTIADDGWISDEARCQLFDLAESLDGITERWSDSENDR